MPASPRSAPPLQPIPGPCIGVFDSGVGGLSVLRALRREMPQARLRYVADSAHAPYGERSDAFIIDRSQRIAAHLLGAGCTGLVVACNTATAMAVEALRARWPQHPIVGVEPGLKPAVAATRSGRIGVLATPGTLASARYRALSEAQAAGQHVVNRPCPELAGLIEQGDAASTALAEAVHTHCAALTREAVDTVVLGCTHYAFAHEAIADALGHEVKIVDTADAVARHAARRFAELPDAGPAGGAAVSLATTGDPRVLEAIARGWLDFDFQIEAVLAL